MLASAFIDVIGVNIRFSPQENGVANQLDKLQEALEYLGIHTIRSPMLNSDNFDDQIDEGTIVVPGPGNDADDMDTTETYEHFADLGYKFLFHYRQTNATTALLNDAISRTAAIANDHPGSVLAIEGPNEPDNFGFTYTRNVNGVVTTYTNPIDVGNFVTLDLIAAANGQPSLASAVTLNSSYALANQTPIADFFNGHPYPSTAGNQPYNRLLTAVNAVRSELGAAPDADVPVYFTETGYSTAVTTGNAGTGYQFEGVSEAVQAKQTLNLLMDAALLGVDGVVLYQLFNGVGEPVRDPTNFGQNYGLFRSPLDADPSVMSSAKPVAHAIHNLTTILSENPVTNMLAGFGYAISGTGVDGKTFASSSLLLDTATGAKDIVIWSEPDIWNEATDTEILAGSSVATISFGTQIVRARIFDPLLDSVVQSEVSYASTVNVNVSDHPLIVQIIATGIDVVGTSAVNVLNGGTGEDRLSGLAGNDTLDGKAGADLMIGGIGNDTYVVDNLGDLVVENLGEGTDTVKTTFDYILGDNIEKLTFTGTAGAHGTGNALANTLLGNTGDNVLVGLAGKDVLTGGAGNDTLIGGEGLDTLTGGVGNDRFVLDSLTVSANRDTIKDFATGQDLIVIDRSVFTAFAGDAAGALDPADFFVGTAAQTSAQHLIFNSANGGLYYDADGAGGAVQVQIAALTNFAAIAPLAASDIVLI